MTRERSFYVNHDVNAAEFRAPGLEGQYSTFALADP